MKERTVPVIWDQIDQVCAFVDTELASLGCPTALRLKAVMIAEELFSAAMDHLGDTDGTLICATGMTPGAFSFRFLSPQGPFSPDYSGLDGLLGRSCTYGLTIDRQENACTVTVNKRPS